MSASNVFCMDCMQALREFPDGFFDLAVVDPPYGINITGQHKKGKQTVMVGGGGVDHSAVKVYGESKKRLRISVLSRVRR